MMSRPVVKVQSSRSTLEGAGVRLRRAFGHDETDILDPFLMLDHFRSSDPKDYEAGFPFHPHRGIETVTYILSGAVEHQDSIGNRGVITAGDVQWMTAGSGILHQEMPRRMEEELHGFQLWVNLPRASKMMPPRYQDIKRSDIPVAMPEEGVKVMVIAGQLGGKSGPVRDLVVPVECFDVDLASNVDFTLPVPSGDHAFAYVFEGSGHFEEGSKHAVESFHVAMFGDGSEVWAKAGMKGCRFLFVHGTPLREPISWGGPVVMNTQEELDQAFEEIRSGNFIKDRARRSPSPPSASWNH